jgi:hypothetical protein
MSILFFFGSVLHMVEAVVAPDFVEKPVPLACCTRMNERPRDTGYSNGVRTTYNILSLIVRERPRANARPGV